MLKCYLAGPITGCSYEECTQWREKFVVLCPRIMCFSPMRGKMYLSGCREIDKEYSDKVLSTARGIMTRDYFDCCNCNFLVINLLDAKRVTIGSCMELAWAYMRQIPVIAMMEEEGNLHEHPMVNEAISYKVQTVEEAAYVANALA